MLSANYQILGTDHFSFSFIVQTRNNMLLQYWSMYMYVRPSVWSHDIVCVDMSTNNFKCVFSISRHVYGYWQVESLKSQLGNVRCEYEGRLQEYAQLLDIKAAHIRKLEGQLRNIAYGTRQYKVDTSKFEVHVHQL